MTGTRSGSRSDAYSPPSGGRDALVLLDTNALFLPFRDHFPLLEELDRLTAPARLAVPASVVAELDRLVDRGAPLATLAREFSRRFERVRMSGRGDFGLLELAVRRRAWVVTSDRELRRRLIGAGVVVLSPRGAKRLLRWEPEPRSARARPARRETVKKRPPLAGRSPRVRPHATRRR